MASLAHTCSIYGTGNALRWYAGTTIALALLTSTMLWHPLAPFGILAIILLLAAYAMKPKLGAGISVIGILFGSGLPISTGIDALGYLDEALILLPFLFFTARRLLDGQALRWLPGMGWVGLYVALGAISSLVNEVPLLLAGQSTFLMLKGFVFAFALAQLDWTTNDVRRMVRPAAAALIFVLAASVVNFLIPAAWTNIFSRRLGGVDYRLGLPSLIGPFDHEFAYGQFMALSLIAIVAFRSNVRKGTGSAILLAGSALGVILSFRRKAIVGAVVAVMAAQASTPGKKTGTIVAALIALPLVVIAGWDGITSVLDATYNEYFAYATEAARTILYRDSFTLAVSAFPLGVGFGRFGSYSASQSYSPVYIGLGYPDIYGLGVGARGPYLSDTFWPAILGEAGFLGLAAFVLGLIVLARQGLKLVRLSADPHLRWAGVVLVAWFVEFGVESVAGPVFNSPPLFGLLFGLAGVVSAIVAQHSIPATARAKIHQGQKSPSLRKG